MVLKETMLKPLPTQLSATHWVCISRVPEHLLLFLIFLRICSEERTPRTPSPHTSSRAHTGEQSGVNSTRTEAPTLRPELEAEKKLQLHTEWLIWDFPQISQACDVWLQD